MLKGYKTAIFNAVMTVVMVLRLWNPDAELPDADTVSQGLDTIDAAIAAIWGTGNMILRAITDTPIFKKEPKQ
jgi:hypothetical protein